MPHDEQKEKIEASLIGKIFCMETMIVLMGCFSLWYGISERKPVSIFWGVTIFTAFFVLRMVRKKDWKKHWEEMDKEQREHEERMKKTREPQ